MECRRLAERKFGKMMNMEEQVRYYIETVGGQAITGHEISDGIQNPNSS
jgi:hypothetical protein